MWKISLKQGTALLLLVLSFSSCSSDVSKSKDKTPEKTVKPVSYNVTIKDMKFQPDVLFVNVGDTVIFTNNDMVVHDVTDTNKTWTSSELPVGKSWRLVVTESGGYYCSIHQVMKGKIIAK